MPVPLTTSRKGPAALSRLRSPEARLRLCDGYVQGQPGFGVADSLALLLSAGNGGEEELREVADAEGVLAVDAGAKIAWRRGRGAR